MSGCPRTRVVTSILKWAGMDYSALKDAAFTHHRVTKNAQQLLTGYNLGSCAQALDSEGLPRSMMNLTILNLFDSLQLCIRTIEYSTHT